jgi:hypothetical protein
LVLAEGTLPLLSLEEIENIKKDLDGGKNPKDAKVRLASKSCNRED